MTKRECIPCNTSRCLLCQIIAITTFETIQTKEKFNIYHKNSCKSNNVTYLLECLLCKIQYVGKSETPYHVRLTNRRKDIKNPHDIEACKHFNDWNHVFHKYGKFILIEQLNNTKNTSAEVLKQKLKDRENCWIKRLKTLTPRPRNQELIKSMTCSTSSVHYCTFFLHMDQIYDANVTKWRQIM